MACTRPGGDTSWSVCIAGRLLLQGPPYALGDEYVTNPEARCERSEFREALKVKAGSVRCRIVSYVGKGFLCKGLALLLVNYLFVWFISGCHRALLLVLLACMTISGPTVCVSPGAVGRCTCRAALSSP